MSNIIKPTANQISLTTANTVYNAQLVFISTTATAVITTANASGNIGSFTLPANQWMFVAKGPTDTVSANIAVYATSSAYRG
jgi:hypothetical protein